MNHFTRDNRVFLTGALLFALWGTWASWGTDVVAEFQWISDNRNPSLDLFFGYATKAGETITYAALFFALLLIGVRYAIAVPLIGVCALILVPFYTAVGRGLLALDICPLMCGTSP